MLKKYKYFHNVLSYLTDVGTETLLAKLGDDPNNITNNNFDDNIDDVNFTSGRKS
jgi:hypothetical protein